MCVIAYYSAEFEYSTLLRAAPLFQHCLKLSLIIIVIARAIAIYPLHISFLLHWHYTNKYIGYSALNERTGQFVDYKSNIR